jgi:predicted outer membrane repeat protein
MSLLRCGSLALVVLASTFGRIAAQSTLLVPSQYPTITAAFAAAVDGDTILVDDGVYNESGLDFAGRRLALRSLGGPSVTVIDGGGTGPILSVVGGEPAGTRIEGFTIRNGVGTSTLGGGLQVGRDPAPGPSLAVVDCRFEQNQAGSGAAIRAEGDFVLHVERCAFTGNVGTGVSGRGAGIFVRSYQISGSLRSALQVESCAFVGNSGAQAAAVSCEGFFDVSIRGCLFAQNSANPSFAGTVATFAQLPLPGFQLVLELSGCTFAGNDPTPMLVVPGTQCTLRDTIFWGNGAAPEIAVSVPAGSPPQALLDVASCDLEGALPSSAPWVTVLASQNLSVDPQFVDATQGDFRLLPSSPVVDAGVLAPAGTDVDGHPRAIDGDGDGIVRVDLGAFELARFGIVATTTSPIAGSPFDVSVDLPRAGDSLVAGTLFGSFARGDTFYPAFGQLLLDPAMLVPFDLGPGSVSLTNPGGFAGFQVHLQAVGVLADVSQTFFELSDVVTVTLR